MRLRRCHLRCTGRVAKPQTLNPNPCAALTESRLGCVEAEAKEWTSIDQLFADVYAQKPAVLAQQHARLLQHLDEFGQHYPVLDKFAK